MTHIAASGMERLVVVLRHLPDQSTPQSSAHSYAEPDVLSMPQNCSHRLGTAYLIDEMLLFLLDVQDELQMDLDLSLNTVGIGCFASTIQQHLNTKLQSTLSLISTNNGPFIPRPSSSNVALE